MNLKKLLDGLRVVGNRNQTSTEEVIRASAAINYYSENKIEEYIAHLATIVEFSEDAIISKSFEKNKESLKAGTRVNEKMYGYPWKGNDWYKISL